MRRLPILLVLAGTLWLGGCSTAPELNDPADIAAVSAVRDAYIAATASGDAAAIGNLYGDGAVLQRNHAVSVTGRDAIVADQEALFSQFDVALALTAEDTQTRGGAGHDRGRYTMTLTPKDGGTPTANEGRYLVLLQEDQDGVWRITFDIDNAATPMPALSPLGGR